jgi:hypothetical protein
VAPCPNATIEIFDLSTGKTLAGTTTAVIGRRVHLGVRSSPAGQPVYGVRWEVDGDTVKSYVINDSTGTRTNLSRADLQRQDLPFYWVDTGGKAVKVAATVCGKVERTTAAFEVIGPICHNVAGFTTQIEIVDAPEEAQGPFGARYRRLQFGSSASSTTHGIHWIFEVRGKPGCEGYLMILQVVRLDISVKLRKGVERLNKLDRYQLDSAVPYDKTKDNPHPEKRIEQAWGLQGNDSPGMSLLPEFRSVARADHFRTYCMYKPDGADCVWVTLGCLEWSWSAEAKRTGDFDENKWVGPLSPSWDKNPQGSASTQLPEWTENMKEVLADWVSRLDDKTSESDA